MRFNSPFSLNLKTHMRKILFELVKRHFAKETYLQNKFMLKVNYSCTSNVVSVLLAHNRNISYPKKSLNLVVNLEQEPIA